MATKQLYGFRLNINFSNLFLISNHRWPFVFFDLLCDNYPNENIFFYKQHYATSPCIHISFRKIVNVNYIFVRSKWSKFKSSIRFYGFRLVVMWHFSNPQKLRTQKMKLWVAFILTHLASANAQVPFYCPKGWVMHVSKCNCFF